MIGWIVAGVIGGAILGPLVDRATVWSVRADERGALAPRPWVAAAAAALLGGVIPILVEAGPSLPAWWLWVLACVSLVRVDMARHRLPDVLVLPFLAGAAALLLVAAASTGDWAAYGRAWAAAGVLFVGYLALAIISPAGMGMGDVKLAPAVGLYLGWLGWSEVLVGTMAGFVMAAVVGIAVVVRHRASGAAAWKRAVPFGPFMLAGVGVALVLGPV